MGVFARRFDRDRDFGGVAGRQMFRIGHRAELVEQDGNRAGENIDRLVAGVAELRFPERDVVLRFVIVIHVLSLFVSGQAPRAVDAGLSVVDAGSSGDQGA